MGLEGFDSVRGKGLLGFGGSNSVQGKGFN